MTSSCLWRRRQTIHQGEPRLQNENPWKVIRLPVGFPLRSARPLTCRFVFQTLRRPTATALPGGNRVGNPRRARGCEEDRRRNPQVLQQQIQAHRCQSLVLTFAAFPWQETGMMTTAQMTPPRRIAPIAEQRAEQKVRPGNGGIRSRKRGKVKTVSLGWKWKFGNHFQMI